MSCFVPAVPEASYTSLMPAECRAGFCMSNWVAAHVLIAERLLQAQGHPV